MWKKLARTFPLESEMYTEFTRIAFYGYALHSANDGYLARSSGCMDCEYPWRTLVLQEF